MNTQRFWLNIFAFLTLSTTAAYGASPIIHQISLPAGMSWCSDDMINGLLTQVNSFRAQNGGSALAADSLGMKDAELRAVQFAVYMQTHQPGSAGFNPHQGYDTTAASIGYNLVSENLAYMTIDPGYVVYAAWQDQLHIAAMLAGNANVAGTSCVYYAGTAYWTYEPGICATCGGTSTPTTPSTPGTPPASTLTMDSEAWAFLTIINSYRAQNGLGTLQVSAALENAALWMSNDMATKNYMAHTDSLGRSSGTRMAAFNYPYSPWGENILAGYSDAQSAFNGWLNACDADASGACTYAHRKNMLTASFKVIGIARAYGGSSTYGWYWTTDFGGVVDQIVTPPGGSSAPAISSFSASPAAIAAGQSATLSWSVSGATSISIDQGIGSVGASGSRTVTPAQAVTYTLTASNASGSVSATANVSVSAAADSQAPTTPSLTSATASSSTRADLAWSASTDNVGVAGYHVLRNGAGFATVGGTMLAFADTAVQAGASYTYAVRAFDAAGNYSASSNTRTVAIPAAPGPNPTACGPAGQDAFTGCYYNNLTLSGTPALVRTDSQINFDWGSSSPSPSVTAGNFSVRWQGNFTLGAGTYTFKALTSDGMRLYLDGNLLLDRWRDQASTYYSLQQTVAAGSHLIVVEYYEHSGWSTAHVTWQSATAPAPLPTILSFSAAPAAISSGGASILQWSVSGATSLIIDGGVGDVSGLSSKSVTPSQTTAYTLTATNSTGSVTARTTVTVSSVQDTQPPTAPLLLSAAATSSTQVDLAWSGSTDNIGVAGYQVLRNNGPLTQTTGTSYSDRGASPNTSYSYTVRAYDAAGNYSSASNAIPVTTPTATPSGGSCPAATSGAFTGCYYNNLTMDGTPALVRTDSQINFDWGTGSPAPSVNANQFSTRWQGYFTFAQGTYTFTATASDGLRLYIDGNLLLDRWRDQAATMYTSVQGLSAGTHLITVEYYERTGWPTAHLTWR